MWADLGKPREHTPVHMGCDPFANMKNTFVHRPLLISSYLAHSPVEAPVASTPENQESLNFSWYPLVTDVVSVRKSCTEWW